MEVARTAGTSPATVSRVLSGQRRYIATETRRRVLAAAARLHYSPNALARGLATRRAPIVAALVHDIADPYFGEMTRAIESVAGERDHLVMVCNWLRDPARLLRYLRQLRAMPVAGIVFCGSGIAGDQPLHDEIVEEMTRLRRYGLRLVALAPQPVPMSSVTVDNRAAAALAVMHLVEHGHRRIGHLTGPMMLLTARHRLDGYRRALRAAHIPRNAAWIEPSGFTMAEGFEGAERLLRRAPEITAIFAANDQMAIGAIAAAERMGRQVPATLSVVGIGNVPVLPFLRPALTSVSVPTFALGEEGARAVLDRPHGRRQDRILPIDLVARDSVARPMDAGGASMDTSLVR